MRHLVEWVCTYVISIVGRYFYLCAGQCWLLLVFDLDEVGVVVEFLLVYTVAICFLAGILVWHPAKFSIFVLI